MSSAAQQIRMNLSRASVLVVEDNAYAMDIMFQILIGFGVTQSRMVSTTGEARQLIGAQAFDMIILDAEIHGEDSFDLVKTVRENEASPNRAAAIILISGFTPRTAVERARDCGISAVLAKPVVPKALLDRIAWIAKDSREFISSDTYQGPDRRFRASALPQGVSERRAHTLQLMTAPERELSQDEISSLFN